MVKSLVFCALIFVFTSANGQACPGLTIENGFVHPAASSDGFSDGATVDITCNSNSFPSYTLVGSSSLTCNNGSWSAEIPVCLKDCLRLIVLNGNLSTRAISSGTTVTASCNPSYKLSGSSSLTCYDGSWSGVIPVCRKVSDCPALTIENGAVSSDDTLDGTTVTIECNAGFPPYTLSGSSSLTCNNGSWSDVAPVCLAGCRTVVISNLIWSQTFQIVHGTTVTLTCSNGYSISGSSSITCDNGAWNSELPSCLKDCPTLTVNNGAVSTNDTVDGTIVKISCHPGYSLSGNSSLICHDGTWGGDPPTCQQGDLTNNFLA